jgi:hypothetical protein
MIKKFKNTTLLDIKNNLAIILLFPALLGGLWQLIELSKMSISFIRFFSPTQLLPDGLLILFMLGISYLSVQLILSTYSDKKINFKRKILNISLTKPSDFIHSYIKPIKMNKLELIDNPIYYRKDLIWLDIFIVIFGILFMVFIFYFFSSSDDKDTFISFLLSLILFTLMVRMLSRSVFVLSILFMENKYNKLKKYFSNRFILKELSLFLLQILLGIIVLFVFILFPIKLFIFFHKEYMLPENLKNLDAISSSLKDNNYTSNKISYFNDKYIFIEHTEKDKNITIEILKFDKLFDTK